MRSNRLWWEGISDGAWRGLKSSSTSSSSSSSDLIVGEDQAASRQAELKNIIDWAVRNNLCLNQTKSAEMVFTNPKQKNRNDPPPPIDGIPRVHVLKLLGVTISDNFSMHEHVSNLISSCEQALYGLRMLKSHGMSPAAVETVFQAVIVSKLTYAGPAWIGFTTRDELDQLDSFLKKSARFSFAPPDQKSFRELVEVQEEKLFQAIISTPDHVLYKLLPPKRQTSYDLRQRTHDFTIRTCKTNKRDSNFFPIECFTKTHTKFEFSLHISLHTHFQPLQTSPLFLPSFIIKLFSFFISFFPMFPMFSCFQFSFPIFVVCKIPAFCLALIE